MMLHESNSQDQEEIVFATTTKNSFSSKQAPELKLRHGQPNKTNQLIWGPEMEMGVNGERLATRRGDRGQIQPAMRLGRAHRLPE